MCINAGDKQLLILIGDRYTINLFTFDIKINITTVEDTIFSPPLTQ